MSVSDAQGFRRAANGLHQTASQCLALLGPLQGQNLQVIFLALDRPDHPVAELTGRLQEVRPEGLLLETAAPLPPVAPHIRFGVQIFGPTGLTQFHTRAGGPVEAGKNSLLLALPERITTMQRRRFIRVPFSGEIAYQLLQNGKPLASGGTGTGIDLSAGGVKLLVKSPLRPEQELLISFTTPDGRSYRGLRSQVVRVERQAGQYAAACRFEGLSEAREAALVQTVFRLQMRSAMR
ncbi:MAG: flagellar brake protein [Bacillota bacterium]